MGRHLIIIYYLLFSNRNLSVCHWFVYLSNQISIGNHQKFIQNTIRWLPKLTILPMFLFVCRLFLFFTSSQFQFISFICTQTNPMQTAARACSHILTEAFYKLLENKNKNSLIRNMVIIFGIRNLKLKSILFFFTVVTRHFQTQQFICEKKKRNK